MSCNRHYGISNYPACSGNGVCIDDLCVCNQHWSGIGDLYPHTGVDCDNNLTIFRYWSLVNLIISSVSIAFISYCLYREIRLLRSQHKSIWVFEGKHTCMAVMWSLNICIFICSILKYQQPLHSNVGARGQVYKSIFAVGAFSTAAYAVSILHLILVKFLRGHLMFVDANSRDHFLYVMNATSSLAVIIPTIFLLSLIAIVTARTIDAYNTSDLYSILLYVTITLVYSYYACTITYIFKIFLRELTKYLHQLQHQATSKFLTIPVNNSTSNTGNVSNAESTVQALYDRFAMVNKLMVPTIINGFILNLSCLCWPFLRRKITYMFIFQSTLFVIITPVMVWSIRSFKFGGIKVMVEGSYFKKSKSSLNPNISDKRSRSIGMPTFGSSLVSNQLSNKVIIVKVSRDSFSEHPNTIGNA